MIMPSILALIRDWLELFRPFEWTKSMTFMLIGAIYALYLNHSALFSVDNGLTFLLGLLCVIMLWSASYTLNDATDWKSDKEHPVKKNRPIPSGRINPHHAVFVSILLILVSLGIAFQLGFLFFAAIVIMLVNQIVYTWPPFRFKDRPLVDVIGGSMVSSFFRFAAGYWLFSASLSLPWVLVGSMVLLQFGAYVLYKLSSRSQEQKRGIQNTITLLSPTMVKFLAYTGFILGFLGLLYSFWFTLPHFAFISLGLGLIPLPLYIRFLKDPQNINIKEVYRLVYYHLLFFAIMFALVFWWFAS